jgi:hypothetical protein
MIYFLRAERNSDCGWIKAGWIKIGTTIRLSERLKQIAAEIGHMPTVLVVLDGAFAEEHALHVRFESDRRYGEWFEPCYDLLRLIETEGRQWDGVDEIPSTLHSVKVDRAVVGMAKAVATSRGIALAELLTEILETPVSKAYAQMLRDLEAKK